MDNYKKEEIPMPEWLLEKENYTPQADKDTFVNKSILSLFQVISRIKTQDDPVKSKYPVNTALKVAFTFMLILLLSLTRSFAFVLVVNVYLLLVLSFLEGETILKVLRLSLLMTLFTFIVMVPSFLWGYRYSSIMITSKVFATITAVSILSHTSKWNAVTGALKRFFVPDLFILVLDITMKYIVMLGDFTLNMLYALKLRSVGKNKNKYTSLSGIAGTMFIKSKEMAEDMYYAMECRGFTGEYRIYGRLKLTVADYAYIAVNAGILLLFLFLWRV